MYSDSDHTKVNDACYCYDQSPDTYGTLRKFDEEIDLKERDYESFYAVAVI